MTDTELLKLAAKAAGVCLHPADKLRYSFGNWGCDTTCKACNEDPSDAQWRPLTDDGDALRLAVALNIGISQYAGIHPGFVRAGENMGYSVTEQLGDDPCAATRRAIVRAAAELGKEST